MGSIWQEIRRDYVDDAGTIYIDAWLTDDNDESCDVIAKVHTNGSVEYLEKSAETDAYAQVVIREAVKEQLSYSSEN